MDQSTACYLSNRESRISVPTAGNFIEFDKYCRINFEGYSVSTFMDDFPIRMRKDGRYNVPLPYNLITMLKLRMPSGEAFVPTMGGPIGEWLSDNGISYEIGETFHSIILETEEEAALFRLRWGGQA
jgi:hypothetical protein